MTKWEAMSVSGKPITYNRCGQVMTSYIDELGSGTVCEHCDGTVEEHIARLRRQSERTLTVVGLVSVIALMAMGVFVFSMSKPTGIILFGVGFVSIVTMIVSRVLESRRKR